MKLRQIVYDHINIYKFLQTIRRNFTNGRTGWGLWGSGTGSVGELDGTLTLPGIRRHLREVGQQGVPVGPFPAMSVYVSLTHPSPFLGSALLGTPGTHSKIS